jgi:DNA-binding beta-propeller fold protein YncE
MKSVFAILAVVLSSSLPLHAADYKVQNRYPIPGTEGWDYIAVDSAARRIYVSRSIRVNVLNADTGAAVGTIEDAPGVHGVAIAERHKHGFTSNGKENKVSMFDTSTLAVIKKIDVGKGSDGIYCDQSSQRVFTNNHGSHNITAIDGATGDVVGTVEIGGNGEGVVTGKDGLVYVALEDKNEIAAFDPKTLEVKRHLPLESVTAPTGLAVDVKNDRLFVGGHNKTVAILDGMTGKQITSFPTGSGTDAAGFDPRTKRIFVSNGEGNLTVIQQHSGNEYTAEQAVVTQPSAKTMAVDKETGKILLPAATVIVTPATEAGKKPTKAITEGTFGVLVVGQ